MGRRAFYNDEAHEYLDTVVTSDREKREIAELVAQDDARLDRIIEGTYNDGVKLATEQITSVSRICEDGSETVDGILEDLRNGDISAREAAAALGAARRDLNKLRKITKDAPQTEQRHWEQVNKSRGEFQRDVGKRFPALFKGGRGLLALPTDDE